MCVRAPSTSRHPKPNTSTITHLHEVEHRPANGCSRTSRGRVAVSLGWLLSMTPQAFECMAGNEDRDGGRGGVHQYITSDDAQRAELLTVLARRPETYRGRTSVRPWMVVV